jgi:hypothetical protein
MTKSLEVFMTRLIDYAGLFPPARLDMPASVQAFARHLDSDFRGMLGCFICPVRRLDELVEEWTRIGKQVPIPVAVLGTRPGDHGRVDEIAAADAAVVARLESEGSMRAFQLEVKWPISQVSVEALNRYTASLAESGCRFERLFFEIDRTTEWDGNVVTMANVLANSQGQPGFKIRTGGVTADLYPSSKEVASAILACRDAGVRFKATAGLHHPIRHRRTGPEVMEHGFFNVFGAGALAHAASADHQTLISVIEDRRLENFQFDPGGFKWADHELSIEELSAARSGLAFSFGSCSFDEPLQDLSNAGLL